MYKVKYTDNFKYYERMTIYDSKEHANKAILDEFNIWQNAWLWLDFDYDTIGWQTKIWTTDNKFFVSWERLYDETEIKYQEDYQRTLCTIERYKNSGVKQYQILGREEGKCFYTPDCFDMNGKIFNILDCKIGENAPPFHIGCRCCISPVMDDEFLRKRQEENHKKEQEKRAIQREAMRLKRQAEIFRLRAKNLKAENRKDEAKSMQAAARFIDKQSEELFTNFYKQ